MSVKKVVLAYSGGLDTSVILRWLIETHRCEVVAYCADLGRERADLDPRQGAPDGAASVHIVDLRRSSSRDFVFPMLRRTRCTRGPIAGHVHRAAVDRQVSGEVAAGAGRRPQPRGGHGKGMTSAALELTYRRWRPS